MSVYGMKPTFKDSEGYKTWRAEWRKIYNEMTQKIRVTRQKMVAAYKSQNTEQAGRLQSSLVMQRSIAHKLMTMLDEGKKRAADIRKTQEDISEHYAQFPLELTDCRNIDFHFNKKHLEYPNIPMWVLKAKGQTFYINHINANCPWTTKENPDHPSTKGLIRFRNCDLLIDKEGTATITTSKLILA